jgi:hypothetical protein
LALAAGEDLQRLGEFSGGGVGACRGKAVDGGGIGAVKEIEEFEVGAELHSFAEIEALIAQQFAVERIVFDD